MSLPAIMKCLIDAPRTILRLPVPTLDVGTAAELTFFNTDEEWTYEQRHIKSKSVNTPYIGQHFKGRATGVYNRGMLVVSGK
jgi:dihydroorotase